VLLLSFAALGAWVYFTDIRGRELREAEEEAAGKLLPVEAAQIVELRLIHPDRSVIASRTGAGWEFVSPEGYEADQEEWDTVAGNVGRIDLNETVASASSDLAPYGLDEPRLRLGVRLADGRDEEVLFGAENPQGTFHYVKLASSDEVVLAASTWMGLFDKTPNDLRDKTILRFEQDDIDSIVVSGQDRLTVRRDAGDWQLEEPIASPADSQQVSTLLGAIDFARASGFVDPGAGEQDTGIESPAWRILLAERDSGSEHELLIGGPVPDNPGQYYARDTSRAPVFLIDSQIADLVSAPVLDWRDKSIVELDRAGVGSIEIARAGGIAALEIRKAGEEWVLADGRPTEFGQVSGMLSALEFGTATGIIDAPGGLADYGLDDPPLRIVLRSAAGGLLLDAAFGAEAADADHVYWKTADQSQVRVVSRDLYDRFDVTAEDLAVEPPEAIQNPE
jgi:hypothetical protein